MFRVVRCGVISWIISIIVCAVGKTETVSVILFSFLDNP